MPRFDPQAAWRSAGSAFTSTLQALDWISEARAGALEPNAAAATAMRLGHARQKLLEALAAIDQRPAAQMLPAFPSAKVGS